MTDLIDIIEIGASAVKRGVAVWQGFLSQSDDPADVEPVGEGDVFQGLGLSSMPYPADANGRAEGIGIRGIGGRVLSWIGARDTRSATIVGNLKPGDTALHSTGPSQAAQFQCKEAKRQAVMTTRREDGKSMVVLLDGASGKLQINIPGIFIEADSNTGNISVTNGQSAILMQGRTIALDGDVILGGKIGDPVNKVAIAPGLPPGVPAAPGIALTFGAAAGVAVALPGG